MELLVGEDPAARISHAAPMDLAEVVALVRQIALGLHAAHRAGIVHRDLKPQNVFLVRNSDGTDRVKLLDFGVSKYRDAQPVTHDNSITGTPNYMSPEQAEGSMLDVDERTDVFALGVVVWEMLAGRLAFEAPTVSGTMYQVVHIDPPPLTRLRPDLPHAIEDVLRTAMAKAKRARYPSGLMLADALADAAATPHRATSPTFRATGDHAAARHPRRSSSPARRRASCCSSTTARACARWCRPGSPARGTRSWSPAMACRAATSPVANDPTW